MLAFSWSVATLMLVFKAQDLLFLSAGKDLVFFRAKLIAMLACWRVCSSTRKRTFTPETKGITHYRSFWYLLYVLFLLGTSYDTNMLARVTIKSLWGSIQYDCNSCHSVGLVRLWVLEPWIHKPYISSKKIRIFSSTRDITFTFYCHHASLEYPAANS